MKPLLIILKTLIIGYLWSVIFIDGIRVVLLINWHFDIFMGEHWHLLSNKWNSGAAMSKSELGFFLVIVSAIPLWLTGWVGLCLIKWNTILKRSFFSPLYLYRKLTLKTKPPVVVKKKVINETTVEAPKQAPVVRKVPTKRPPLPSATLMQSNIHTKMSSSMGAPSPYKAADKKNPEMPTEHALFNFDDDDFDLDFDFDKKIEQRPIENKIPSALMVDEPPVVDVKPVSNNAPKNKHNDNPQRNNDKQQQNNKNKQPKQVDPSTLVKESHTPVLDVLKQKEYDVISSAIIKNNQIDYVAVSKNQIYLCLVDKEIGDWLADEEKFNDEEPLWFSESSHRISPVRKVDLARDILRTKLAVADMKFEINACVIIQSGNIINAEDMFEIWNGMNISVTRINRGSPKELRLFSKSIDNCEEKTDKATLEKLKKLIFSLA